MNFEQARFNMIEQQVRPWEVLDTRVLSVMANLQRERFVPEDQKSLAYADVSIPLGDGQRMMPPRVEGRMVQALNIEESDIILEVGSGSGYVTALLAALGKHVYSVDIRPVFTEQARRNLEAHRITNVTFETGDAAGGWDRHAPYDVIAITGSFPAFPEHYQHSLKVGGRMFVVVGEAPVMEAMLIQRSGENTWSRESLFETELPPLDNVKKPQRFVF